VPIYRHFDAASFTAALAPCKTDTSQRLWGTYFRTWSRTTWGRWVDSFWIVLGRSSVDRWWRGCVPWAMMPTTRGDSCSWTGSTTGFCQHTALATIEQLENCPRLRVDVSPTAFRTETLILTLTLTSYLDLQSHESYMYGHEPYTCKWSWRSKITRFKIYSGNRRTVYTYGRRRLHYLPLYRGQ